MKFIIAFFVTAAIFGGTFYLAAELAATDPAHVEENPR